MIPVVTVAEMRRFDSESTVAEHELIRRAGWAVFLAARRLLGGTYGRCVTVVAGKGNNGADGRVAASLLARQGVRVHLVDAVEKTDVGECDLVIDAAYGTGFTGRYNSPDFNGARVLAVDIPSGVSGDSGIAVDSAVRADATVALAALKPGHLFGRGPELSGLLHVSDIGLDVSPAHLRLIESVDVRAMWPRKGHTRHKWNSGVAVVGGSRGMTGAATLVSLGAHRTGAGIVQLFSPGSDAQSRVIEVVARETPAVDWSTLVIGQSVKCRAMVIGCGLGRSSETFTEARKVIASVNIPLVVDADALHAVGPDPAVLLSRSAPTVITPHDGEYETLTGAKRSELPWKDAESLARSTGCVVLLKGPVTVVAEPNGRTVLVHSGDQRLATAGTGDVLSGMIGALLAHGLDAFDAATAAAHVHGEASKLGNEYGFMAGDLPGLVSQWQTQNLS